MNIENISSGVPIKQAKKVLILLHGRGARSQDILSIARHLNVEYFAFIAPEAENRSWYPYSFLAPIENNEPQLSKSLDILSQVLLEVMAIGVDKENIYFLGFSQGACLALEFTARNASKYGGIVAFTGGLIGDMIYEDHYKGNFNQTPIFIGSSSNDLHVPEERVNETEALLRKMGAEVTKIIYDEMGHTITEDEVNQVNELIFSKKKYSAGKE